MVSASHHVFCTTFTACTPSVSVDEVPSKGTRGDGVGGVGGVGVEASVTGAFFSVSTAFDAVTASRSPVALASVSTAVASRSSRGVPADAKPCGRG